ncbi:hypothetical protein [Desulfoglaeba alkanexedens]|uniref:Uncharacterized protein n=1 Tax=Desulfoglaeba alkanexedens ALDC TaxID=980445 RepID=A0A4P8L019_9BACT|nr:hypothetical protein [Desulfoglaeba alkanexedens]QCQ21108.1 hypothetical protein FDQ92_02180 [Desulfoglaeba alkanexedens ALDC]
MEIEAGASTLLCSQAGAREQEENRHPPYLRTAPPPADFGDFVVDGGHIVDVRLDLLQGPLLKLLGLVHSAERTLVP